MQATEDSKLEPVSGAASATAARVLHSHLAAPSKPWAASEPPTERYRAQLGVSAARAAGATVLLDVRSGLYHTLNQAAGRLWDVIEKGDATFVTLVDVLHVEHGDVPREIITRDVMQLLSTLLEAGLITADPACRESVARGEGGSA